MPFKESCYHLSDTEVTRANASRACRPGHLADITTEEEQAFVVKLLKDKKVRKAWFGLLKTLSWSDGSPLIQESWQNVLINNDYLDRCFRLAHSQGYRWNDIECGKTYKYICEYESK